jgi:prenyltransferase beta subunit
MIHCLDALSTPAGAWVNEASMPIPNVPSTAAAVTLARNFRQPIPDATPGWILSNAHAQGGFMAFSGAPIPDLLSTAVALHALDGLQVDYGKFKDACLDFVDSLWTAEGGFHGNWEDDALDIEYTYYGLLALGHLSL